MQTICQTLNSTHTNWWYMWANDAIGRLERLKSGLKPRHHIPVIFEATEYRRAEDGTFECQHARTETETIYGPSDSDEGLAVEVCRSCGRHYDEFASEWVM